MKIIISPFNFMLFASMLWSCSNANISSKEKVDAIQQSEKAPTMQDMLQTIYVDSISTECECIDALLKVTDLMIDVPTKKNLEFTLAAISEDTVAIKEIKEGHMVFNKIIARCIHQLGVTQEQINSCPNYKKVDTNTDKLKTLKL